MALVHLLPEESIQDVDQVKNYRKLIMFAVAAAIIAFIPLSDANAEVLKWLIGVAIGGNAVEYLSQMKGK